MANISFLFLFGRGSRMYSSSPVVLSSRYTKSQTVVSIINLAIC
jgi:hypothetical protein